MAKSITGMFGENDSVVRNDFAATSGKNSLPQRSNNLWGLILAGGDGKRLREFVRLRFNSDRPKQFCTFHGTRSMLGTTVDRVRRRILPQRLLVTINSRHREFVEKDLCGVYEGNIIVQPENKETCAAILLPLLHIQQCDPGATVCIFPADHFVQHEARFMQLIESAAGYINSHPHDLLLVGAVAQYPETDYGWIEPSQVTSIEDSFEVLRVQKFWEKPSFQKAEQLTRRGCLWNTMVMVGRVTAFLEKFRRLTPDLFEAFQPIAESLGFPLEEEITRQVYASLPCMNFSVEILEREVRDLVVLPARGVYWSDWGRGERIEMDLALMNRGTLGVVRRQAV